MTRSPFADCLTLGESFKRLIEIEAVYAPKELHALWARDPLIPPAVRDRLSALILTMRMGNPEPREFERKTLAANAHFFRSGVQAHKTLLVCFSGKAGHLMIPTAPFLQFIPEDRFDVLVLRDPSPAMYLRGIDGLGADFTELLEKISDFAARHEYREIRCYGTSAGGAPALYAAMFLDASIGVAIGGHHPAHLTTQLHFPSECTGEELDLALAAGKAATANPDLILAFGESCQPDWQGAQMLQQRFPKARYLAVQGCDRHNINAWLLRNAAMQQFLDETILTEKS